MNDISLIHLLEIAWRRFWVLLIAAVIFAGAALSYCKLIARPSYSATASILVTNGAIISSSTLATTDSISGTDITASLSLATTITDILKTSGIFKQLATKLGDEYTYRDLMLKTGISRRNENSLFVDITFSSSSPAEAVRVVNNLAELAPEYITEFVPHSQAVASYSDQAKNTYPRTGTTTAVAGILGAVLAYALVFIIDLSDQAIKGEEDFAASFEIPLIGTVPDFENAGVIASPKGGYGSNV